MSFSPTLNVIRDLVTDGNLTADANVDLHVPRGAKGLILVADFGTVTGSIAIKVQHAVPGDLIDGSTANFVDIAGAAFPTINTANDDQAHYLTIYPGIAASANVSVDEAISGQIRVVLDVTTGPIPMAMVLTWLF